MIRCNRRPPLGALAASATVLLAWAGPAGAADDARAAPAQAPAARARLAGVWGMDLAVYRSSRRFSARERVATDVDGKPPPLQPWAAALLEKRVREADEQDKIFANNAARCLPQGVPYLLFAAVDGPIQIIESPGQVTILTTELAEHWLIYLDQSHRPPADPNYHGDSVGHWEGETLVVDTIGLGGDKTTLDQVGTPHSDRLHVVTRITPTGPDDLDVRVWMEDPGAFLHPWERRVRYHRAPPGTRIEEWVCENTANAPDAAGYQGFHPPTLDAPGGQP